MRKGRVSLPNAAYLVTTATHGRAPLFLDFPLACAAIRAFAQADRIDARLLAWVLMPDHVHWLLQLDEVRDLSSRVRWLKSTSAQAVNRLRGQQGPVWARAFHDRAVRGEDIRHMARYIVANPLRAGLVERVGAYPYWNAAWL